MPQAKINGLIRRWFDDPQFRRAMRANPVAAASQAGFALDSIERDALAAMDWNATDEQLSARISAMTC